VNRTTERARTDNKKKGNNSIFNMWDREKEEKCRRLQRRGYSLQAKRKEAGVRIIAPREAGKRKKENPAGCVPGNEARGEKI